MDVTHTILSPSFANWLADCITDTMHLEHGARATGKSEEDGQKASTSTVVVPVDEHTRLLVRSASTLQAHIDAAAQIYRTQEKHLARLPACHSDLSRVRPNSDSAFIVMLNVQLQQARRQPLDAQAAALPKLLRVVSKLAHVCGTRIAACDCAQLVTLEAVSAHLRHATMSLAAMVQRLHMPQLQAVMSHCVLQTIVLAQNLSAVSKAYARLQATCLKSMTRQKAVKQNERLSTVKTLVPDMKPKGLLLPLDLEERRSKVQPRYLRRRKSVAPTECVVPNPIAQGHRHNAQHDAEKRLCTLEELAKLWTKSLQSAAELRGATRTSVHCGHRASQTKQIGSVEAEQYKNNTEMLPRAELHDKPVGNALLGQCLDATVSDVLNGIDTLCDDIVERLVQQEFA